MDTFMANLPSGVEAALRESISTITTVSMISIGEYNALETVLIAFDIFKNHRGLYFWSMQVASWGILVHALPAIVCTVSQAPTLPVSIPFMIGWYAMVTGQAVVLYSRLRLVVLDTSRVRWVLWMIIANVCILHVPMTVLFFSRISGDARYDRPKSFVVLQRLKDLSDRIIHCFLLEISQRCFGINWPILDVRGNVD